MAIKESMDEGPFEEYYKNGTLKRKGSRKCGSYDGSFEEYYENGQLKEKCSYSEGLTNGPYERYWENGQLFFKEYYKQILEIKVPDYSTSPSTFYYHFFDNKGDGEFLFYLKDIFKSSIEYLRRIGFQELANNDTLIFDIARENDIVNRNCKSFYDNGQLKFQNKLENCEDIFLDKGIETFELYFKSGQLKFKNTHDNDISGDTRNSQLYYENGQLKENSDHLNGYYEQFYEDGTLKEKQRNDTYEKYYDNGQLHYRINLEGLRKNGPFELFDRKGVLIEKGSYSYDEFKNGISEGYYEDGQLMDKCFYKNGLIHGEYLDGNGYGDIRIKGNYVNGVKQDIKD